eukprot:g787.t1
MEGDSRSTRENQKMHSKKKKVADKQPSHVINISELLSAESKKSQKNDASPEESNETDDHPADDLAPKKSSHEILLNGNITFDRTEVLQVLHQSLHELGYHESASTLVSEHAKKSHTSSAKTNSSCSSSLSINNGDSLLKYSENLQLFLKKHVFPAIVHGKFNTATDLFKSLPTLSPPKVPQGRMEKEKLFQPDVVQCTIRLLQFCTLRHHYLELIQCGQRQQALILLRKTIIPCVGINDDDDNLNTSMLMIPVQQHPTNSKVVQEALLNTTKKTLHQAAVSLTDHLFRPPKIKSKSLCETNDAPQNAYLYKEHRHDLFYFLYDAFLSPYVGGLTRGYLFEVLASNQLQTSQLVEANNDENKYRVSLLDYGAMNDLKNAGNRNSLQSKLTTDQQDNSGGQDAIMKESSTGEQVLSMKTKVIGVGLHQDEIWAVAFGKLEDEDNSMIHILATGSKDGEIKIWRVDGLLSQKTTFFENLQNDISNDFVAALSFQASDTMCLPIAHLEFCPASSESSPLCHLLSVSSNLAQDEQSTYDFPREAHSTGPSKPSFPEILQGQTKLWEFTTIRSSTTADKLKKGSCTLSNKLRVRKCIGLVGLQISVAHWLNPYSFVSLSTECNRLTFWNKTFLINSKVDSHLKNKKISSSSGYSQTSKGKGAKQEITLPMHDTPKDRPCFAYLSLALPSPEVANRLISPEGISADSLTSTSKDSTMTKMYSNIRSLTIDIGMKAKDFVTIDRKTHQLICLLDSQNEVIVYDFGPFLHWFQKAQERSTTTVYEQMAFIGSRCIRVQHSVCMYAHGGDHFTMSDYFYDVRMERQQNAGEENKEESKSADHVATKNVNHGTHITDSTENHSSKSGNSTSSNSNSSNNINSSKPNDGTDDAENQEQEMSFFLPDLFVKKEMFMKIQRYPFAHHGVQRLQMDERFVQQGRSVNDTSPDCLPYLKVEKCSGNNNGTKEKGKSKIKYDKKTGDVLRQTESEVIITKQDGKLPVSTVKSKIPEDDNGESVTESMKQELAYHYDVPELNLYSSQFSAFRRTFNTSSISGSSSMGDASVHSQSSEKDTLQAQNHNDSKEIITSQNKAEYEDKSNNIQRRRNHLVNAVGQNDEVNEENEGYDENNNEEEDGSDIGRSVHRFRSASRGLASRLANLVGWSERRNRRHEESSSPPRNRSSSGRRRRSTPRRRVFSEADERGHEVRSTSEESAIDSLLRAEMTLEALAERERKKLQAEDDQRRQEDWERECKVCYGLSTSLDKSTIILSLYNQVQCFSFEDYSLDTNTGNVSIPVFKYKCKFDGVSNRGYVLKHSSFPCKENEDVQVFASPSQDNNLYIWSSESRQNQLASSRSGRLLDIVSGHFSTVNAVATLRVPQNYTLMATVSDDHTVRVYSVESLYSETSTDVGSHTRDAREKQLPRVRDPRSISTFYDDSLDNPSLE